MSSHLFSISFLTSDIGKLSLISHILYFLSVWLFWMHLLTIHPLEESFAYLSSEILCTTSKACIGCTEIYDLAN